ncbi:helix-turn-helix domain-containing protein [Terrisporobacter hibernicus]|uniref:Helix-turn-helix domain-containing protein n=1 Tax=Terrisporobacter hibernicus TaxID=2813371 RepID=A0AAX2ZJL9_9FIRM|nr:helix-turn-helix domain-containing protein [Terrisporobacter hibernicus]UEL48289.1 helix-turn-helix domain-containing protein [Terrisporobacter hibernicus]
MSYTLIDNEIFEDENLTHTEFRVLSYLIRNYNSNLGYSFPTRKTMVEKCNMSKDTLNKVLNSLEERGYITRKTNPSKSGRNNIYYIHKYLFVPSIEEVPDEMKEIIEDKEEVSLEEKDVQETEELIRKFYAGEISAPEQVKKEELKEKLETFQVHLNRKMSSNLKEIIKDLDWSEIVDADMQININKKENYVTEKYIINAIYDNKRKVNLKLVK